MDLTTAMRVSANWYFEELLRRLDRLDPSGTAASVRRLGYGNQDAGGDPLRFWVDGALRISAVEQTDFFARLWSGVLPLSARTRSGLTAILRLESGAAGGVLYGKTGTALGATEAVAWLVGVLERPGERLAYATLLRAPVADAPGLMHERLAITRALLARRGEP
jgi:beta-lactamase class D